MMALMHYLRLRAILPVSQGIAGKYCEAHAENYCKYSPDFHNKCPHMVTANSSVQTRTSTGHCHLQQVPSSPHFGNVFAADFRCCDVLHVSD